MRQENKKIEAIKEWIIKNRGLLLFDFFLVLFVLVLLWIKPANILKDYGINRAVIDETAMIPVYNGVYIEQDFDNPRNADSLEIRISSANNSYRGSYRLDLYDEKNNYITGWIEDKFNLATSEWIEFKLDRNILYSGNKYKIIISAEELTCDNAIVVYLTDSKQEHYLEPLLFNSREKEGSLCMGVYKSIPNYFAIFALVVLLISANVWWYTKEYGVEKYSIPLLIGTGLIMFLIMAPGSGPDETYHYYSAFELSNSILGRRNLSEVEIKYRDTLPLHVNSNRAFVRTLTELRINNDDGEEFFVYDGVKDKLIQPMSHIAPALGITFGRLIGMNFICIYELGRLFNLIAYIFMAWLAVRIVPQNKELMLLFGILPMYMHQACQMSYDPIVNGFMMIFVAYVYKIISDGKRFTWKNTFICFALLGLLSPIKVIYSLLVLLLFAIQSEQFNSLKDKYIKILSTTFGTFVILFLLKWRDIYKVFWSDDYRIPTESYSPDFALQMPTEFIRVIMRSVENSLLGYMKEVIGISLSGYTVRIPEYLVLLFWCIIVICALASEDSILKTGRQKIIVMGIMIIGFVAVYITFIFAYTPYAYPIIQGIQGRYFTPFIIPVVYCLSNRWIRIRISKLYLFVVIWFVEAGYLVSVMNQVYFNI